MDPTSYHYNDDVKNTEFEEDHFVKHVCAIGVYYYFSCDICSSSRLASIARGGILLFRMLARTNETQDVII